MNKQEPLRFYCYKWVIFFARYVCKKYLVIKGLLLLFWDLCLPRLNLHLIWCNSWSISKRLVDFTACRFYFECLLFFLLVFKLIWKEMWAEVLFGLLFDFFKNKLILCKFFKENYQHRWKNNTFFRLKATKKVWWTNFRWKKRNDVCYKLEKKQHHHWKTTKRNVN